jgi:adenine deaminase
MVLAERLEVADGADKAQLLKTTRARPLLVGVLEVDDFAEILEGDPKVLTRGHAARKIFQPAWFRIHDQCRPPYPRTSVASFFI